MNYYTAEKLLKSLMNLLINRLYVVYNHASLKISMLRGVKVNIWFFQQLEIWL